MFKWLIYIRCVRFDGFVVTIYSLYTLPDFLARRVYFSWSALNFSRTATSRSPLQCARSTGRRRRHCRRCRSNFANAYLKSLNVVIPIVVFDTLYCFIFFSTRAHNNRKRMLASVHKDTFISLVCVYVVLTFFFCCVAGVQCNCFDWANLFRRLRRIRFHVGQEKEERPRVVVVQILYPHRYAEKGQRTVRGFRRTWTVCRLISSRSTGRKRSGPTMYAVIQLDSENHRLRPKRVKMEFVCKYCNRTFNKHYSLLIHERNHMPSVNYRCEMCYKSFKRQDSLQQHRSVSKSHWISHLYNIITHRI